jgi:hypothetical protein
MRLFDPETQLAVNLDYDSDGFPIVTIDTATSGDYYDGDGRPTIEVHLNDELLHPMFADAYEPVVIHLSDLQDYLGQFEGGDEVVLLASATYPEAIVLASLFDFLATS